MEDNLDNDPLADLLIPEVSMSVDDEPYQLNEEETEKDAALPIQEQNGDVIEVDGESNASNNASGELNDPIDANQENKNPAQIPEIYTFEEMAVLEQIFGPGQQAVQFLRLHCTACNVHLGSAPNKQSKRYIHPLLKVLVCKSCYEFYGSGDFDKDEDGSELYCRWCGQGGKVLCCAQCPYVFCQKCIRTNLGKKTLDMVKQSDDWTCFACKPAQIINLRVTCRALFDFAQEEIRIAAELKQPQLLSSDLSMCCHTKPKAVATKRKRSDSTEITYEPFNNDDTSRKKKKIKLNILSHMSAVTNENLSTKSNPVPIATKAWEESQVEDEVVCTPDLSMLMDDDESSVPTPTASPQHPPASPQPSCSSLVQTVPSFRSISPFANSNVEAGKDSDIQYIGQTRVLSSLSTKAKSTPSKRIFSAKSNKALGYKLPTLPLVLNTSTTKPLTTTNIHKTITPNLVHLQAPAVKFSTIQKTARQPIMTVAHNRNNSIIDSTPARLAPGLRYEWFEKAAQVTARVNQHLSTKLCTLSNDQGTVSSLEALANIHNNLQEVLSSSINSLMQIRKNLRSDFIAGLKKLKFCKNQESISQPQTISDDSDVIIVDSHTPDSTVPISAGNSNEIRQREYIKVKPVSQLLDSSIITIPDDNVTTNDNNVPLSNNIDAPKQSNNITNATDNDNIDAAPIDNGISSSTPNNANINSSNSINGAGAQNDQTSAVGNGQPASNYVNTNDALSEIELSEVLNPETVSLIKRAVLESKFDAIVNENLKFTVKAVTPDNLKRMLSVRVVVETNFGSATPKTRPRKGYKPMEIVTFEEQDFEQMLSSSTIVVNTSKRKAFDDSFSAFLANESHITNDSHITNIQNDDEDGVGDPDDKPEELVETDNLKKASIQPVNENEETSRDPHNTDSGIDVDGEQSNGVINNHDNE